MSNSALIQTTDRGLYCPPGDFYVDPWQPVDRAVITHAHADHARAGHQRYLTAAAGKQVLQTRLGAEATIDTVPYGEAVSLGSVRLSLHPAGHLLGSSQVRIEHRGQVCVVSGDYKTAADPTCAALEPLACHTFVTESTFGLPIYCWPDQVEAFAEINSWWRQSRDEGRASVVFAYALGKAQRLLAGIDASIGPIACHGAVERINADYRRAGVTLPETSYASDDEPGKRRRSWSGALIVAPPSAMGSPWLRRFGDAATAFVSGWMLIRGMRRRRNVDRGFVLSDHADWPGLLETIAATCASQVRVTHGQAGPLARYLAEQGWDAAPLSTPVEGERDESSGEDT